VGFRHLPTTREAISPFREAADLKLDETTLEAHPGTVNMKKSNLAVKQKAEWPSFLNKA